MDDPTQTGTAGEPAPAPGGARTQEHDPAAQRGRRVAVSIGVCFMLPPALLALLWPPLLLAVATPAVAAVCVGNAVARRLDLRTRRLPAGSRQAWFGAVGASLGAVAAVLVVLGITLVFTFDVVRALTGTAAVFASPAGWIAAAYGAVAGGVSAWAGVRAGDRVPAASASPAEVRLPK